MLVPTREVMRMPPLNIIHAPPSLKVTEAPLMETNLPEVVINPTSALETRSKVQLNVPSLQLINENNQVIQEGEVPSDESDAEEPSPEALARYLSMRRHTSTTTYSTNSHQHAAKTESR
uniref:Uncharacterized protein n=1 Tax=Ciona savignyi TaxID=51511 RepID=H2YQW3_CIOSA